MKDSSGIDALELLLRRVPFFRALDRVEIARLMGALEEVSLSAGTVIVAEGAEADGLYLLGEGRVEVSVETPGGERSLAQLGAPGYFGELGLVVSRRSATVRATSDVRLWKLPRPRFEQLVRERPALGLAVASSAVALLESRERQLVGAPVKAPPDRPAMTLELPPRPRRRAARLAGFAAAVGVPLVLWSLPPPSGLGAKGWHVSLIVLGAALGFLLEPLPDFVVALLMAAAWGVVGLASPTVAFAGFASSTWLVALGALGVAVAMARSGLLFRIALLLLRTFPATHAGQVLALLLSGVVVTPLVPLALARVAAVAPLTRELAQALRCPPKGRAGAALAFAALAGYGLLSSVFLTGLVMNFFVVDLLPPAGRAHFTWLIWLLSAAPAGVVVFAGAAGVLLVLFRPEVAPKATGEMLRRQQQALGTLSPAERGAILAGGVLLVGLLLQPVFQLDAAWVAIGALAAAVGGGALNPDRFRGSIDWGFLTFFGVMLGTGGVLHSVGVDAWIADSLVPLARSVGHPAALVLLLSLFVFACRLVVPWIPATLLLSLALVPAAPRLGLSPWVVGFVVLVSANTWLHPSQSDFYRVMRDATEGELFTERQGLLAGAAMTAVTLLALAVSIPYWGAIGILTP